MKFCFGLSLLASAAGLSLVAESPPTETEKWIGPVLTSIVNLAASGFAFMNSRDRLKYDANSQITADRLKKLESDNVELREDRRRTRMKLNRVIANLQSTLLGKPMPYPNELGYSDDLEPPNAVTPPKGSPP